jgi:hypothetical protein
MMDEDVNSEEFDDKYSPNEEVIEIPTEVRKINTQAYDKSVSDIVRMMNDRDINLNPEYQRNYIWDNKKASMLIESIILNVPIPVIYVSQEVDDTWTVIDGLQRLNSLKRFFDRDFKLSGLELLSDLNKSDVQTLNPKALRILKNGLLRIIVISHDSHEDIKYDVFMRLNRGSVKLNEQELRNCLYRGAFNDLLKELSSNSHMQALMNIKEPHNRMIDCELILRFLALRNNWSPEKGGINSDEEGVSNYRGRMKNFLNDFMRQNQNTTKEKIEEMRVCFNDTVKKIYDIFGTKAFRRINENEVFENSLNRAIMDSLLVSFSFFAYDDLVNNKEKITECFYELVINDQSFKDSITIGTSDKKVLNYRIDRWYNELANLING